jgi:Holliday junction resolvase
MLRRLAYIYLDKFSVKHAFFETDRPGIKQDAGIISGKEGRQQETNLVLELIDHGVPAVRCDITNTLRHGDVCILSESDPLVFEVKTGAKLNQRGRRQLAKLQQLHSFLETDSASEFRGRKGTTKRVELDVSPRDNLQALNDCIAHAQRDGQHVVQPEPGVTYAAIYGKPDFDAIFSKLVGKANAVFMLNEDKNDRAWAPYMPFVASIRDEEHLLDFIEGRLFLIVVIDAQVLCDMMSNDEWAVRYRQDHDYVIQCLHRPSKAFVSLSGQFRRAGYEFASLAWIAEAHRPSLERLKDFAGDSFDPLDQSAHERSLLEFFGPDDEWTQ